MATSLESVLGDAASHSVRSVPPGDAARLFQFLVIKLIGLLLCRRDDTEVKPVIVGVTQRQPGTSGRLLRP